MYLQLFTAALFLLLRHYLDKLTLITIDVEYPGHEATIRGLLLGYIWRVHPHFPKDAITFAHVGKKSPAHAKAIAVYRRKQPPNLKLHAADLLALVK